MVVVVANGKIADLGKFGRIRLPKNSQVIDATGKFLIPGLWDMHAHLTKAGESTLPLFVANGVTSVRDMGGDYIEVLKWRKEAADGTRLSPRIKTAGALLESAENVARMKREGTVEPVDKFRIGIATPEEARKAVDLMASLGVNFIKLRTVASPAVYNAIAEESKAKGLMFVGHQFGSPDVMIAAGQKSIEHYIYPPIIMNPKHAEIYKQMAERGVYVVPTPWLVKVALNLSRDQLRRRRRREYFGPWLPSPVQTEGDCQFQVDEATTPEMSPAARYDLRESVTLAFLLALEAPDPCTARGAIAA